MKPPSLAFAFLMFLAAVAFSPAQGQHDFHTFHGAKGGVPKLNYDSLAAVSTPLEDSPEGRTLAEACLARYGGVEKLRELRRFRLVYWMKSFGGADSVEVVKTFERGRKYRVRTPRETRMINGGSAWFRNANAEIDLDGGRYRAELFSYLTLAMPLAMTEEPFDGGVRYGKREGDSLGYFYMEKVDSLIIVLGIDPADSLIKSSEGVIRQEEQSFVFINRFAEHRDVGGFPFANHLVNISMGLEVGRSRLESVDIDPEFGANEFGP
jgi:hypothetical protein